MTLTRELLEFSLGGTLLLIVFWQFKGSLKNRKDITLIDISIWITGTSFGLAPFVLYLYGGQFPEAKLTDVFLSYLGIILFISGLVIIKKYFKKTFRVNKSLYDILINVNNINSKQVLVLYSVFFIVRAVFAFSYGIFSSGTATIERMQSLPYYLIVSRSLLDLVFWGCIFWSFVKILSDKKLTLLPSLILIIEILLIFFRGRRQMLYFVFLFVYIYILLGYKINFKVLIPTAALIIILVNIIFPYFLIFREISLGSRNNFDLLENYSYSYYTLLRTGIDKYHYEKNIADRVYINTWNIDIVSKSSLFSGLNGQALFSSIIWVIPSPLFPYKSLLKEPEYLINYNFGLSLRDSPSNWIGYGFADFGLLGGLFYGLLLGLVLSLMKSFANFNLKKFPLLSFIILGSVSFIAFFIEETPVATFSVIRDIILLYFIFNFFYLFSSQKSKRLIVS